MMLLKQPKLLSLNQVLSDVYKKCPRSRYIVGYEVAGIVTQTGSGVSNVAIGDSVVGKFTNCAILNGKEAKNVIMHSKLLRKFMCNT